ncbi:MAG: hypothetical protein ABII82_02665 [Verrucomicrobiota bacterium]
MPRLYLLIPCVLLILFGGLYWNYARTARAEAAAIAAEQARVAETAAAEQAAAEQAARETAEKRAAERAAAEAKAETERREKWQAEQARLTAEVAELQTKADQLTSDVAGAEKTLSELETTRRELRRANLAAGLAVERLRIAKSTAELELQRLVTLLARQNGAADPALDLP